MPDRRRRLLNAAGLALLAWPLAGWAKNRDVLETPIPGVRPWGRGEFRRFGFLVYEASLWAGDDPTRPPLALRLDYKRRIAGSAIAEASVKEMRRFGGEETVLAAWHERMARIFPDVQDGDHILGVYTPTVRASRTTAAISAASTMRVSRATSSASGSIRVPARPSCARRC